MGFVQPSFSQDKLRCEEGARGRKEQSKIEKGLVEEGGLTNAFSMWRAFTAFFSLCFQLHTSVTPHPPTHPHLNLIPRNNCSLSRQCPPCVGRGEREGERGVLKLVLFSPLKHQFSFFFLLSFLLSPCPSSQRYTEPSLSSQKTHTYVSSTSSQNIRAGCKIRTTITSTHNAPSPKY